MDRSPATTRDAILEYDRQLADIEQTRQRDTTIDRRYGAIRVVWFLGFLLSLLLASSTPSTLWITAIAFCLVGFVVSVTLNETVRDRLVADTNREQTLRRLRARTQRDWKTLSKDRIGRMMTDLAPSPRQKALADDLDLLGDVSLWQLVSMTGTQPGARTLMAWLCDPADVATATSRHRSVEHLAPRRNERIEFYTLAREIGGQTGDPDRFVQWATSPAWLASRKWLIPWSNLTLVIALSLVAAMVTAVWWLPAAASGTDWQLRDVVRLGLFSLLVIAIINFALTSLMLGPVAEIFSIALSSRRHVEQYARLFETSRWLPADENGDPHSIAQSLTLGGPETPSAAGGMRSLAKVAKLASLKQTAATFLVYLPLQAFALWDVRVLRRLEDWKQQHQGFVEAWFSALGELESLLSLAALRDETPDWASPQWSKPVDAPEHPAASTLVMTGLGHPLLPDHVRVLNDVTIGPRGTLLLVTGSNMSGKSTMLRSVGLNASLAMAGGPVCCRTCALPPLELSTSIRVSDDLGRGVSYYMAELNRLADVVQHARQVFDDRDKCASESSSPQMLFLLDEILQGTNSRERQIAVARVLRHLIGRQAIGAITTHDLELADDPELQSIARVVHFRETIEPTADGNDRMTFDYKMREGVSPTTNALRLLEMVGLGAESASATPPTKISPQTPLTRPTTSR